MAEQPSPTWNFRTGELSEMAFFKRGELMIMKAKEQYAGEFKGLQFQKKADIKALEEARKKGLALAVGSKAKAQVKKKYQTDLAALNKQYKKSFADLRIEKQENIAAGKAATAEAFRTGYMPPTPESKTAKAFTSEYAEELATSQTQTDAAAEGMVTAEQLMAGLQESQRQLAELFSGSTSSALSRVTGTTNDLISQFSGTTADMFAELKNQRGDAFKIAQDQLNKTQAIADKTQLAIKNQTDQQAKIAEAQNKEAAKLSAAEIKAANARAATALKQQAQLVGLQIDEQELLRQQDAEQFAATSAQSENQFKATSRQSARQFEATFRQSAEQFKKQSKQLSEQFGAQYEQSATQFAAQQKNVAAQLAIAEAAYKQQTGAIKQQDQFQKSYLAQLRAAQTAEANRFAKQYGLSQATAQEQREQFEKQYGLDKATAQAQARQFAATFDLQKLSVAAQQDAVKVQREMMKQRSDIAAAERLQEQQAYSRQLTQMRNQARMNLTPELQLQTGAQGSSLGGTSMFKRSNKKEEIIPKNTLGITQQSASNSLNIA